MGRSGTRTWPSTPTFAMGEAENEDDNAQKPL